MSKSKGASAPALSNTVTPKQRCRKGDLAIRTDDQYSTPIVTVDQYCGKVEFDSGLVIFDAWQVLHSDDEPGCSYYCEDKFLLPIRPGDLDETETYELSLANGRSA